MFSLKAQRAALSRADIATWWKTAAAMSCSDYGVTPYRLEGRHTAARYVEILENVLLPSLDDMHGGRRPHIVQQDNAPQHTARPAKACLVEHQEETTILEWATRSPDLNIIIENVWRKTSARRGTARLASRRPLGERGNKVGAATSADFFREASGIHAQPAAGRHRRRRSCHKVLKTRI